MEMQEHEIEKRGLIYIDETTFNSWMSSDRSWSFADEPIY